MDGPLAGGVWHGKAENKTGNCAIIRPRQELYSNSGMNSRLEQPVVREGVRKGALFVYFYRGVFAGAICS